MSTPALFKWRHFLPDVILLNVRWQEPLFFELRRFRGDDAETGDSRWIIQPLTALVLKYAVGLCRKNYSKTKERLD